MARLPNIESEQSKLTTVLCAISHAKRMRILDELSDERERSVSELEGVITSPSQSAISQHLARLRRATLFERAASHRPSISQSITAMCFASSDFLAISKLTIR